MYGNFSSLIRMNSYVNKNYCQNILMMLKVPTPYYSHPYNVLHKSKANRRDLVPSC